LVENLAAHHPDATPPQLTDLMTTGNVPPVRDSGLQAVIEHLVAGGEHQPVMRWLPWVS